MDRRPPAQPDPPAGLTVRSLEPGDRDGLCRLAHSWWGRDVADLLARPFFTEFRDTSFVLERTGEPAAFLIGFLSQTDPESAYIHVAAVAPDERRRGVATYLYRLFFS